MTLYTVGKIKITLLNKNRLKRPSIQQNARASALRFATLNPAHGKEG